MKPRLEILPPAQRELWDEHGKLTNETKRALTLASMSVDPAAIRPISLLSAHLSARHPVGVAPPAEAATQTAERKESLARKEGGPGKKRGRRRGTHSR
jgi:hypothetical protein